MAVKAVTDGTTIKTDARMYEFLQRRFDCIGI